jgi:hypothetical protein
LILGEIMKQKIILAIASGLLLFSSISAQKKTPAKASNTTKIFGVNLIKNGNAESGNGNGWRFQNQRHVSFEKKIGVNL